jgi:hypothetical protein
MDDPAGRIEENGAKLEALSNLIQHHSELGGVALIIDDIVKNLKDIACTLRTKGEDIKISA